MYTNDEISISSQKFKVYYSINFAMLKFHSPSSYPSLGLLTSRLKMVPDFPKEGTPKLLHVPSKLRNLELKSQTCLSLLPSFPKLDTCCPNSPIFSAGIPNLVQMSQYLYIYLYYCTFNSEK